MGKFNPKELRGAYNQHLEDSGYYDQIEEEEAEKAYDAAENAMYERIEKFCKKYAQHFFDNASFSYFRQGAEIVDETHTKISFFNGLIQAEIKPGQDMFRMDYGAEYWTVKGSDELEKEEIYISERSIELDAVFTGVEVDKNGPKVVRDGTDLPQVAYRVCEVFAKELENKFMLFVPPKLLKAKQAEMELFIQRVLFKAGANSPKLEAHQG